MISSQTVETLSASDLLARTHELVQHARCDEADLLIYLGEIDYRKLYLDRPYSSLFAFCIGEFRFSEDVTCSRIAVARAARDLPGIIDVIRSGDVHLTGVRLLLPLLTPENHRDLLQKATGKSKREIEELVVTLSPKPLAPTLIRKIPVQATLAAQPQAAAQPQLAIEPQVTALQAPAAEDPTSAPVAIALKSVTAPRAWRL